MKDWTRREENLRKHGERDPNLRKQRLLGIIREIYHKIDQLKPANVFLENQARETLEDYYRESELQRSNAILHVSRLQFRLT